MNNPMSYACTLLFIQKRLAVVDLEFLYLLICCHLSLQKECKLLFRTIDTFALVDFVIVK